MNTLIICQTIRVEDSEIFKLLDDLPYEDEPTDSDAEAEELCIEFIEDNYLQDCEDVDPTECGGFNALKAKIEDYLYLKRYCPEKYKRLEERKMLADGRIIKIK